MTEFNESESFGRRVRAAQRSCDELEALSLVLGTSDDTLMHRSKIKQLTEKLNEVLNTLRSDMTPQNTDYDNELDQQASWDLVEKVTNNFLSIKRTSDKKMKNGNGSSQKNLGLLSNPQGGSSRNPFYETISVTSDDQVQELVDLERKKTYTNVREQKFLERAFVPTTFKKTYFNYANSILGTGILALPYAIRVGGLSALILMAHSAWATMKSSQLLVQCFYEDGDCSKKLVRFQYRHIACDAFSSCGWILDIMFNALYLVLTSVFLSLCAETLESISSLFSRAGWVLFSAGILLIIIIALPNLDKMAWLNLLGIINVFICAFTICVFSVMKIMYQPEELAAGFVSYKFFDWRGMLVAYNICAFSMGTLLVSTFFCEMKEQHRFNELSRLVYITVGTSKLVFTFIAFFAFQGVTADSVSLNIKSYIGSAVVSISIVVDKLVTTPLILYPPRLELEALFPKPENNSCLKLIFTCLYRFIVATFLLAICIALAVIIPNFAIFVSLTGSIFVMTFICILPVMFWLRLTKKKSRLDKIMGFWILLTSSLSMLGGTYQNLLIILS